MPGTDSDRARLILERHFGERPDGVFTVVFRAHRPTRVRRRSAGSTPRRTSCRRGHATRLTSTGGVLYGEIDATLDCSRRRDTRTGVAPRARRRPARVRDGPAGDPARPRARALVRPAPRRGDRAPDRARRPARRVRPLARGARAVRVRGLHDHRRRSAVVYAARARAHDGQLRHEPRRARSASVSPSTTRCSSSTASARSSRAPRRVEDAVVRTMATAGRAVVFSGATVAIGLALLLLVPVPFIRSLGVGGFLVPLVSIAAALTLQPRCSCSAARPCACDRAGIELRARRHGDVDRGSGRASRARSCAGRCRSSPPAPRCSSLPRCPRAWLQVTPGSIAALPRRPESMRGARAAARPRRRGRAHADARSSSTRTQRRRPHGAGAARGRAPDARARPRPRGARRRERPAGRRTSTRAAATRASSSSAGTSTAPSERGSSCAACATRSSRARASRRACASYAGGAPPQGVDFLARSYGCVPVARRSPCSRSRTSCCCARSARCCCR